MTDYETIEGTPPQPETQHEARTVARVEPTEAYIMSEIGDGVFVQWGTCARCSNRVATCTCPTGPQEADHIKEWRTQRFEKSFAERGISSLATPRAVAALLDEAQLAQDAAYGDSNDTEIELLRDALERALGLLGLQLPEGVDPEDVEDEDEEVEDELHHDGKHEIDAEQEELARPSSAFERPADNVYHLPDGALDPAHDPLKHSVLGRDDYAEGCPACEAAAKSSNDDFTDF